MKIYEQVLRNRMYYQCLQTAFQEKVTIEDDLKSKQDVISGLGIIGKYSSLDSG